MARVLDDVPICNVYIQRLYKNISQKGRYRQCDGGALIVLDVRKLNFCLWPRYQAMTNLVSGNRISH